MVTSSAGRSHEGTLSSVSTIHFLLSSGEGDVDCARVVASNTERSRRPANVPCSAKVPHVAVNRGKTRSAVFIGVRNEPTRAGNVVMLPELDTLVREELEPVADHEHPPNPPPVTLRVSTQ